MMGCHAGAQGREYTLLSLKRSRYGTRRYAARSKDSYVYRALVPLGIRVEALVEAKVNGGDVLKEGEIVA